MESLPLEVLCTVCKFLGLVDAWNAQRVNRRFREAVHASKILQQYDMFAFGVALPEVALVTFSSLKNELEVPEAFLLTQPVYTTKKLYCLASFWGSAYKNARVKARLQDLHYQIPDDIDKYVPRCTIVARYVLGNGKSFQKTLEALRVRRAQYTIRDRLNLKNVRFAKSLRRFLEDAIPDRLRPFWNSATWNMLREGPDLFLANEFVELCLTGLRNLERCRAESEALCHCLEPASSSPFRRCKKSKCCAGKLHDIRQIPGQQVLAWATPQ